MEKIVRGLKLKNKFIKVCGGCELFVNTAESGSTTFYCVDIGPSKMKVVWKAGASEADCISVY